MIENAKPIHSGAVSTAPLRTMAEVNQDYTQAATQLGDRQFKIELLSSELNQIVQQMRRLDAEAAHILKSQPDTEVPAPQVSEPALATPTA